MCIKLCGLFHCGGTNHYLNLFSFFFLNRLIKIQSFKWTFKVDCEIKDLEADDDWRGGGSDVGTCGSMTEPRKEGDECCGHVRGPSPLLGKKKIIFFFFFKNGTQQLAAFHFSPYTCTLNMINNGTHWGRKTKKKTKTQSCVFSPQTFSSWEVLSVL